MSAIMEAVFKSIPTIREEDTVMLKINVTPFTSAKTLNVFGNDTTQKLYRLICFERKIMEINII